MTYVPSTAAWVREQVEAYESSDGEQGYELRGYPCVIVTHTGRRTDAIRKTPLMRVVHDGRYILVGSIGGAPKHPQWVHNLRAQPDVTVRDKAEVMDVRVREVTDPNEREEIWATCVASFPDYATYRERTDRVIPLFVCEPR